MYAVCGSSQGAQLSTPSRVFLFYPFKNPKALAKHLTAGGIRVNEQTSTHSCAKELLRPFDRTYSAKITCRMSSSDSNLSLQRISSPIILSYKSPFCKYFFRRIFENFNSYFCICCTISLYFVVICTKFYYKLWSFFRRK